MDGAQVLESVALLNLVVLISVNMYKRVQRRGPPTTAGAWRIVSDDSATMISRQRRRAAQRTAFLAAVQDSVNSSRTPVCTPRVTRIQLRRKDYNRSTWWEYCDEFAEATWGDPTSANGKLFRRRFRMPWHAFQEIYQEAFDNNWFPQHMPGTNIHVLHYSVVRVVCLPEYHKRSRFFVILYVSSFRQDRRGW